MEKIKTKKAKKKKKLIRYNFRHLTLKEIFHKFCDRGLDTPEQFLVLSAQNKTLICFYLQVFKQKETDYLLIYLKK